MPAGNRHGSSGSELFYDLALVGAFLSFGVDFSKSPRLEAAIVLALKLIVIFWAWEQTSLFFNRFGDAFASRQGLGATISLLRATFLAQLVGIVALSLVEGDRLSLSDLPQEIGIPSAAIMLALAATHELGRRWRPRLGELASNRRNAALLAAVLFICSGYPPQPWGTGVWLIGLACVLLATAGRSLPDALKRFPYDRDRLAERAGLLVLIILGDVFVKIVVNVHEDDTVRASILQLSFVAVSTWMVWSFYERNVASFPAPGEAISLRLWTAAHYVLCSSLLIAGAGLVWYVAPAMSSTYGDWIAMIAVGGIGLAIAAIAALRALTAEADAIRSALGLVGISAVTLVIGALAWLATPSDWRVGVGSMAVWLILANRMESVATNRKRQSASIGSAQFEARDGEDPIER